MKDEAAWFLWGQIGIICLSMMGYQLWVGKPEAKAQMALLAPPPVKLTTTPTLVPTVGPTLSPTPTPTPTPKPTATPKPRPTQIMPSPTIKKIEPTIVPTPPQTLKFIGANGLTQAVNNYRRDQGKAELKVTQELCAAAKQRAEKVGSNLSHDGYEDVLGGIPHSGSGENLWWGTEINIEAIVKAWDESGGHKENMLRDWAQGCGEIAGNTAAFLFIN